MLYFIYMKLPYSSHSKSNAKGFTLIELLMSVSLILIVTGALIPSFNAYMKSQSLKQAQEFLKSDLRSVQNKALTGAESQDTSLKYWGVKFSQNSANYTYHVSTTTDCGALNSSTQRGTATLPGVIVVKSPSGCVFFSMANGNALGTDGLSSEKISLGYPSGTDTKEVLFNSGGLIYSN